LTCPGEGGEWVVVDRSRDAAAIASCRDQTGAALLAALMNGDLSALAGASPETLAQCRSALLGARRGPRAKARPSVGISAFPQL